MAEIGDKSFTTDMIQLIKDAVKAELGTNAYVNRYLAEVTAVNSTTSEVSVKLSGSDSASDSFRFRGLQMPSVGDQVIACIDGQDRWIESVIRPSTSTPYLQIASGSLVGAGAPTGAVLGYLWATPPSGWLLCNGATYNYDTYPALGALFGKVSGQTFTLPDMQDRFMAGLSAAGTWSNTTGTLSPSAGLSDHQHTFTGTQHSHDIAHGHGFSAGAHTHAAGTYNPTATDMGAFDSLGADSPSGAAGTSSFLYSGVSGTYRLHTHSVNPPSHDHGFNGDSGAATYSSNASVTNLGATSVTATATGTIGNDDYTTAESTPKATLLNFIIKT